MHVNTFTYKWPHQKSKSDCTLFAQEFYAQMEITLTFSYYVLMAREVSSLFYSLGHQQMITHNSLYKYTKLPEHLYTEGTSYCILGNAVNTGK